MTLGRPAGQRPGEPKSFFKIKQNYTPPTKKSPVHEGHRSLFKVAFVLYLHSKPEVAWAPNIS